MNQYSPVLGAICLVLVSSCGPAEPPARTEDAARPSLTAASPFCGGAGSAADPYRICSVADLQRASLPQYQDASFRLMRDLDLAGINFDAFQITLTTGTFDGGGHTLANLTMDSPASWDAQYDANGVGIVPSGYGLFKQLNPGLAAKGPTLKNLNVTINHISAPYSDVGLVGVIGAVPGFNLIEGFRWFLVGASSTYRSSTPPSSNATITNVNVRILQGGYVEGVRRIGALFGSTSGGTIINDASARGARSAAGDVRCRDLDNTRGYAGGSWTLLYNPDGSFNYAVQDGTHHMHVGGLGGYSLDLTMSNASFQGSVVCDGIDVAGLLGAIDTTVDVTGYLANFKNLSVESSTIIGNHSAAGIAGMSSANHLDFASVEGSTIIARPSLKNSPSFFSGTFASGLTNMVVGRGAAVTQDIYVDKPVIDSCTVIAEFDPTPNAFGFTNGGANAGGISVLLLDFATTIHLLGATVRDSTVTGLQNVSFWLDVGNDVGGIAGETIGVEMAPYTDASGETTKTRLVNNAVTTGAANTGGVLGFVQAIDIHDLEVVGGSVTGVQYVGGIGGFASDGSTVTNVSVSGVEITGQQAVGGALGWTFVNAQQMVLDGVTVEADTTVTSTGHGTPGAPWECMVGGLIGSMQGGVIQSSSSAARLTCDGNAGGQGGLVGNIGGYQFSWPFYPYACPCPITVPAQISASVSHASLDLNAVFGSGGLVGVITSNLAQDYLGDPDNNPVMISDSYSTSEVPAPGGGLIALVKPDYTGAITVGNAFSFGESESGCLYGQGTLASIATTSGVFFNQSACEGSQAESGGLSQEQFGQRSSFPTYDFKTPVWRMGEDRPVLAFEGRSGGDDRGDRGGERSGDYRRIEERRSAVHERARH